MATDQPSGETAVTSAKKPKGKPQPSSVTITYDLLDLPTSQHKAGLAGLLMQIDSMRNRDKTLPAPEYAWDAECPDTKVHVTLTEATTKALFDDLYDATWVEGQVREKPYTKGKGDKKVEVPAVRRAPFAKKGKGGAEKTVEGYVYLELTPTLATLRRYLPTEKWLQLWRDLIWQVVRDSKKKAPYIRRAEAKAKPAGAVVEADPDEGPGEDEDGGEGGTADGSSWADLLKYAQARARDGFAVGRLSSALLLGAQSRTAEVLPFSGRVDQNLLLHFWPITSLVYVPRFLDGDGNSHIGRRDKEDKTRHFCLAVPEVSDLRGFLADYPRLLGGLDPEVAVFRPREALVDLAAEGGLSFVEHLARLVPQRAAGGATEDSISGVDYLHLNQNGNIVRLLSTGRVPYSDELAGRYRLIVGRPQERPPYGNPLFRRTLIAALLADRPWFEPFGELFAERDVSFFVPTDAPPKVSWFWADARKKLKEFVMSADEVTEAGEVSNEQLAVVINRIVSQFLLAKAKKLENLDPKAKLETLSPDQKKKVYDRKSKVAQDVFYRTRARPIDEFPAFFAEEICSFGTYFDRKTKQQLAFAVALINSERAEDIRTLTLLTVSANA